MNSEPTQLAKSSGAADALMIALSLVSVCLLFFEVLADHSPAQTRSLELADLSIAFIFLGEFSFRLLRAPQKALFLRKHWWELLASIPFTSETTQVLRAFNLLRLFRLVRLLRLIRFAVRFKILLDNSARFARQTYLVTICTALGLVIMAGALGFHYLESEVNPNVHGLWNSFWWTIVTITTVGYGDITPVTTGGRVLAIFLMLGGIATMGAATAAITAYVIERKKEI